MSVKVTVRSNEKGDRTHYLKEGEAFEVDLTPLEDRVKALREAPIRNAEVQRILAEVDAASMGNPRTRGWSRPTTIGDYSKLLRRLREMYEEVHRLRRENALLGESTCSNCDGLIGWESSDRYHPMNRLRRENARLREAIRIHRDEPFSAEDLAGALTIEDLVALAECANERLHRALEVDGQ